MKINATLKFLLRQSRYINPAFGRLLSSTMIQPHFNYGCSSWFPLLKKSLRIKLWKAQNRRLCSCSCLHLPSRSQINPQHLGKINWLSAIDRAKYRIANTVCESQNGIILRNIHEMFMPLICTQSTRWQVALDIPLRKTDTM